jgi:hypothetical protein
MKLVVLTIYLFPGIGSTYANNGGIAVQLLFGSTSVWKASQLLESSDFTSEDMARVSYLGLCLIMLKLPLALVGLKTTKRRSRSYRAS